MKHRIIVVGLIEKDGQYLLGKKPEDIGPYPNTWHLPGGGVNLDGETLEEALRREIKEETGISINKIESLGFDEDYEKDKHGEMTRYIFLDFKANYLSGTIKANDDMKKLKWIKKKDLKDLNLNKPTEKLLKKLNLI
jgi:8-oxo-dGTP diphosphatase